MDAASPKEPIAEGFADPVMGAQRTFRTVLDVVARPGTIAEIAGCPEPPPPISSATLALVLALADFETPVWLDASARAGAQVIPSLRFHCGCPVVEDPATARFALVADAPGMPPLSVFDPGTPESPDQSTTVIVQVAELAAGVGMRWSGPGIAGEARVRVSGLPPGFESGWRGMQDLFPCGVDIVFVAGRRVAALPRTTRIEV